MPAFFQTLAVIDLLGFLSCRTEHYLLAVLCDFLLSRGLPVGKEEVFLRNPEPFLCHWFMYSGANYVQICRKQKKSEKNIGNPCKIGEEELYSI